MHPSLPYSACTTPCWASAPTTQQSVAITTIRLKWVQITFYHHIFWIDSHWVRINQFFHCSLHSHFSKTEKPFQKMLQFTLWDQLPQDPARPPVIWPPASCHHPQQHSAKMIVLRKSQPLCKACIGFCSLSFAGRRTSTLVNQLSAQFPNNGLRL